MFFLTSLRSAYDQFKRDEIRDVLFVISRPTPIETKTPTSKTTVNNPFGKL